MSPNLDSRLILLSCINVYLILSSSAPWCRLLSGFQRELILLVFQQYLIASIFEKYQCQKINIEIWSVARWKRIDEPHGVKENNFKLKKMEF